MSRAELAEATGLTRATVSRLVADLLAGGLVSEAGRTDSGQPGRPATPLLPASGSVAAVGLEVNVDHAAARVIDLAGGVLGEFVVTDVGVNNAAEDLAVLGRRTAALVRSIRVDQPHLELCGVSMAVSGLVSDSRVVRFAPNLRWRDVTPADLMGPEFGELGTDLVVENDANLQAVAASRLGPGRMGPDPTFLFVSGDIGVGAAVVEAGDFRRGRHGWAGELGHATVDTDGPICACGSRGCLEQYAGRRAMHMAAGLVADFGSQTLVDRLRDEDPVALEVVDRAGWALGVAIANALNLLDLRKVILGTSLAEITPWVVTELQQALADHLLWAELEAVEVLPARPDRLPAATGGAYHLLETVIFDPAQWLARRRPGTQPLPAEG